MSRGRAAHTLLMALVGALLLAVLGPPAGIAPPTVRAAAGYTMQTEAEYRIDPATRSARVTVQATFRNTTPNPAGSFSTFDSVPFAVQDGASGITATDGSGRLVVRLSGAQGARVARVTLRAPLRYAKTASLRLSYLLADGAAVQIRIRPTVVVLPIWSFGTSGTVTARMPSGYAAQNAGATMTAANVGDEQVLSSGPIADPTDWRSLLTATSATTYETTMRSIPLTGGTVDLRVRSWSDDPAWGERTADLLEASLPLLEEEIGLPYAGVGPLVVTESVPAGSSALAEPQVGAQEIAMAFDVPPFTALHQAAHVWIGTSLATERWIREGLASHAAAAVAARLKAALPFAPTTEADRLAGGAFPLAAWGTVKLNAQQEGWAYAASWAFVDRIAAQVGEATMRRVLQRAAAGVGAYDAEAAGEAAAIGHPSLALDGRTLIDQLEQASGSMMAAWFAERVFTPDTAALVAQRATARTAYQALVARAGDWGAPDRIRAAMASWNFADAQLALGAAQRWLDERDRLLAAVEAEQLSIPSRLRDSWLVDGGGPGAQAELNAELAVVSGYHLAATAVGDARGPIEALGLLGSPDPVAVLATAAGMFANGDLQAAAEAIQRASDLDASAQAGGVVRMAAGAALLAVALAAVVLAGRRLRRWHARRALRA
jgi:hypothetical protein